MVIRKHDNFCILTEMFRGERKIDELEKKDKLSPSEEAELIALLIKRNHLRRKKWPR